MSDFINYLSNKNKKIGTYLIYENILIFLILRLIIK